MNSETVGNRLSVTIYGKMSSGKSKVMNGIIGQEVSIVSREKGTTTDPVSRPMELASAGPVLFTDTAGIDDDGNLGQKRVQKTIQTIDHTDLALYVMDSEDIDEISYAEMVSNFEKRGVSHLLIFNKVDKVDGSRLDTYRQRYPEALFLSAKSKADIEILREKIEACLGSQDRQVGLLEGVVSRGDRVLVVVSIDQSYPKGRLILPQVEIIREILDRGGLATVIGEGELDQTGSMAEYSLVIVDSSIYGHIEGRIPLEVPLTTFSILFSRKKGDLNYFVESVKSLDFLQDCDRVLICESCKHSTSHEDIARVKIPKAIDSYTARGIVYHYSYGSEFPKNLSDYRLIVHCGACMEKRSVLKKRVARAKELSIPMTNYGVLFAYISGNLDRTVNFL